MCGIAGVFRQVGPEAVQRMVRAMHHRGPDDHGVLQIDDATLGMARLAILDLSPLGHQPMLSDDRQVALVYNGELYNFASLRHDLEQRGHVFRSRSDTEVVLKLYLEHGPAFVERMRGMFALALYDRRPGPQRARLLLARDQLGIKPLLYTCQAGRLVFASEIKAILASGLVPRQIDPEALRLLLTFGSVHQPRTMIRDVFMLPPGHRMVIDGPDLRIEPYWQLSPRRRPDVQRASYPEQVAAVAAALKESVRLHLVSDVPVGAFLSGGIDSSLLVALMAREHGSAIRTFSVGFPAEGQDIDESVDAQQIAQHIGTQHTRVRVTGQDVRRRIKAIAAALDQPSVDGVNAYFVSQAARTAVTVAISGTGGDELFAGYPWFSRMLRQGARDAAQPMRSVLRRALGAAARRRSLDRLAATTSLGPWLARARAWGGLLPPFSRQHYLALPHQAAALLAAELRPQARLGRDLAEDLRHADELPDGDLVQRVTALCLRGYTLHQLLRDIDAVSMSHSLEVRVPFLDPAVTDLALALPRDSKLTDAAADAPEGSYRQTGAKRILIDLAGDLLPPGLDRQVKRGFAMPFASWLHGPLQDVLHDTLSETAVRARGLLNPAQVTRCREAFQQQRANWTLPWLMMMLELWCREVLDGAVVEDHQSFHGETCPLQEGITP